jgi:hypothetical protein
MTAPKGWAGGNRKPDGYFTLKTAYFLIYDYFLYRKIGKNRKYYS